MPFNLEPTLLDEHEQALYRERAQLIAAFAAVFPSVICQSDPDALPYRVVYVDTPQGQLSWYISPRDLDLFEHVESVEPSDPRAHWDGHSTAEKYFRLGRLTMLLDQMSTKIGKAGP